YLVGAPVGNVDSSFEVHITVFTEDDVRGTDFRGRAGSQGCSDLQHRFGSFAENDNSRSRRLQHVGATVVSALDRAQAGANARKNAVLCRQLAFCLRERGNCENRQKTKSCRDSQGWTHPQVLMPLIIVDVSWLPRVPLLDAH